MNRDDAASDAQWFLDTGKCGRCGTRPDCHGKCACDECGCSWLHAERADETESNHGPRRPKPTRTDHRDPNTIRGSMQRLVTHLMREAKRRKTK